MLVSYPDSAVEHKNLRIAKRNSTPQSKTFFDSLRLKKNCLCTTSERLFRTKASRVSPGYIKAEASFYCQSSRGLPGTFVRRLHLLPRGNA